MACRLEEGDCVGDIRDMSIVGESAEGALMVTVKLGEEARVGTSEALAMMHVGVYWT